MLKNEISGGVLIYSRIVFHLVVVVALVPMILGGCTKKHQVYQCDRWVNIACQEFTDPADCRQAKALLDAEKNTADSMESDLSGATCSATIRKFELPLQSQGYKNIEEFIAKQKSAGKR